MNPVLESLPVLILYPHSRCNCRCVMCDIWKTDSTQEISASELERHGEDIARLRVQWVVFSGGEPLMHSDLFRLCRFLRERKIRTTLLSTGLLIERYASQIAEHLDDVIVSLDGPREIHDAIRRVPRAFDLLAAGVTALHQRNPDLPVSARSTVQNLNCAHLRATVEAARSLELKSVSFLAADVSSEAFNRPNIWSSERQNQVALIPDQISALETEVEALIGAGECGGFVAETPEKLRRIVDHFQAHLDRRLPVAPRCNAPWVSAVVESDGVVRPCFFHRSIGTLGQGASLLEVLNGPQAIAFRRALDVSTNATCRRCVCSLNWNTAPATALLEPQTEARPT
ncbi:MAG TPA: radical SAM protein [Bryobacteraceae bacterium]|jgi:MoaA/NifB/PqqE/SkfB family radical SAM enzyme|nr:radical SAM protein [Bryobacteraceae bacterium]